MPFAISAREAPRKTLGPPPQPSSPSSESESDAEVPVIGGHFAAAATTVSKTTPAAAVAGTSTSTVKHRMKGYEYDVGKKTAGPSASSSAAAANPANSNANSNANANPTPWRHPAELPYVRKAEWSQEMMIEYMRYHSFSVPGRDGSSAVQLVPVLLWGVLASFVDGGGGGGGGGGSVAKAGAGAGDAGASESMRMDVDAPAPAMGTSAQPQPQPQYSARPALSAENVVVWLPRGYRVPLMFIAKFQWESLRLVLTAPDPDADWTAFKYNLIHLSRLCQHLFLQARLARAQAIARVRESTQGSVVKAREKAKGEKELAILGGFDKGWRCEMFDRLLVRFYQRWFLSEDKWLRKFWDEFDEEEYEADVVKHDWARWAIKGHAGFSLSKEEIQNGITAEEFMRGLIKLRVVDPAATSDDTSNTAANTNMNVNRKTKWVWDPSAPAPVMPALPSAQEIERSGLSQVLENVIVKKEVIEHVFATQEAAGNAAADPSSSSPSSQPPTLKIDVSLIAKFSEITNAQNAVTAPPPPPTPPKKMKKEKGKGKAVEKEKEKEKEAKTPLTLSVPSASISASMSGKERDKGKGKEREKGKDKDKDKDKGKGKEREKGKDKEKQEATVGRKRRREEADVDGASGSKRRREEGDANIDEQRQQQQQESSSDEPEPDPPEHVRPKTKMHARRRMDHVLVQPPSSRSEAFGSTSSASVLRLLSSPGKKIRVYETDREGGDENSDQDEDEDHVAVAASTISGVKRRKTLQGTALRLRGSPPTPAPASTTPVSPSASPSVPISAAGRSASAASGLRLKMKGVSPIKSKMKHATRKAVATTAGAANGSTNTSTGGPAPMEGVQSTAPTPTPASASSATPAPAPTPSTSATAKTPTPTPAPPPAPVKTTSAPAPPPASASTSASGVVAPTAASASSSSSTASTPTPPPPLRTNGTAKPASGTVSTTKPAVAPGKRAAIFLRDSGAVKVVGGSGSGSGGSDKADANGVAHGTSPGPSAPPAAAPISSAAILASNNAKSATTSTSTTAATTAAATAGPSPPPAQALTSSSSSSAGAGSARTPTLAAIVSEALRAVQGQDSSSSSSTVKGKSPVLSPGRLTLTTEQAQALNMMAKLIGSSRMGPSASGSGALSSSAAGAGGSLSANGSAAAASTASPSPSAPVARVGLSNAAQSQTVISSAALLANGPPAAAMKSLRGSSSSPVQAQGDSAGGANGSGSAGGANGSGSGMQQEGMRMDVDVDVDVNGGEATTMTTTATQARTGQPTSAPTPSAANVNNAANANAASSTTPSTTANTNATTNANANGTAEDQAQNDTNSVGLLMTQGNRTKSLHTILLLRDLLQFLRVPGWGGNLREVLEAGALALLSGSGSESASTSQLNASSLSSVLDTRRPQLEEDEALTVDQRLDILAHASVALAKVLFPFRGEELEGRIASLDSRLQQQFEMLWKPEEKGAMAVLGDGHVLLGAAAGAAAAAMAVGGGREERERRTVLERGVQTQAQARVVLAEGVQTEEEERPQVPVREFVEQDVQAFIEEVVEPVVSREVEVQTDEVEKEKEIVYITREKNVSLPMSQPRSQPLSPDATMVDMDARPAPETEAQPGSSKTAAAVVVPPTPTARAMKLIMRNIADLLESTSLDDAAKTTNASTSAKGKERERAMSVGDVNMVPVGSAALRAASPALVSSASPVVDVIVSEIKAMKDELRQSQQQTIEQLAAAHREELGALKEEMRGREERGREEAEEIKRRHREEVDRLLESVRMMERERERDREREREKEREDIEQREKGKEREKDREMSKMEDGEEEEEEGGRMGVDTIPALELRELRRRVSSLEARTSSSSHDIMSSASLASPSASQFSVDHHHSHNGRQRQHQPLAGSHPLAHLMTHDFEDTPSGASPAPMSASTSGRQFWRENSTPNPGTPVSNSGAGGYNNPYRFDGGMDLDDSIPLPAKSQRKMALLMLPRPSTG